MVAKRNYRSRRPSLSHLESRFFVSSEYAAIVELGNTCRLIEEGAYVKEVREVNQ